MSNMVVREVEFNGANLLGVQDEHGKVYVGVNWITQGIGLDKNGHDTQVKKIKNDVVLSKGASNLTLPTNGGLQEVLTLDIEYLPIWLAKISITPKMQENSPDVVEKLVEYQLKAKDVLANAFIHNKLDSYMIDDPIDRAKRWIEECEQRKTLEQRIMLDAPKVTVYDKIADSTNLLSMNETAKTIGIGRNTLFSYLRDNDILMKNNLPYETYKNRGYFEVKDVPIRKGDTFVNQPTTRVTSKGLIWLTKKIKNIPDNAAKVSQYIN